MVQINWTTQAVSDLKNIHEYISNDSEYYARREISKIKLRTEKIKKYIKIGRIVPEVNNSNIREVIEGRYRIVYRILNLAEVDILIIHHSSRNEIDLSNKF